MKRKRLTGKERIAKYAAGGIAKYPTGGELGPTPPPTPTYIPDAFQPFSQEYAMIPGTPPKPKAKPIKLKDTRTINPVTGKPFSKDKLGSKSISVDPAMLQAIISHAKAKGIDPLDALAIPYQESNFGAAGTGLGEVKDYYPDQEVTDSFNDLDERKMNEEANQMVKALKDKFDYAKRLGYNKKGRAYQFQAYNGYGKLKPPKGQASTSYYGMNVTNDAPLDMAKNPLYGKVVSSLRDVLASNPEIQTLIKNTQPFKAYSNFATGGEANAMASVGGGGGGDGYSMAAQLLPQIGNALQSIFTKPQQQSDQPIMNAQTAKTMTSPYAFGGELADIDEDQYQEWLKQMFANQLASETGADESDDAQPSVGVGEDLEGDEEDSFAMGGKAGKKHWIQKAVNPAHKGYCTPMTKSTCTPKRKALARTFKKHHGFHAMGGPAYANGGMTNIEVEGDEVVETPNGDMQKMQGPSHEQGGIPMAVPVGTKIYSDRLQIEGKTMQQRKLSREKKLKMAVKNFESKKHDALARNTYERTKEIVEAEDQQDMQLQKFANKLYSPPQQAAYGDEVGDPWSNYVMSQMPDYGTQVPFLPGADTSQLPSTGSPLSGSATGRGINVNAPVQARTAENIGLQTPSPNFNIPEIPQSEQTYSKVGGFTTGDYIGMGANLFNAIAPIINTKNAARATKPEINRFKGFGREALEANAKAQGFAGTQFANAKRDLDTATNSAILRNRMGARSINTTRALDTVADINRNKAAAGLYGQYTDKMSGLLTQEGQLANQRDQMEMSGATARDQREAQNRDNYYTNLAENLTNLGTNVGNIGAQLNKHKANQDNADLLAQMSEYFDFGRDQSGKLVLKNKKR